MRIDIRDSKYSIIYNEKTGAVEDVLWCNESAEDLKNLNVVADMARELAVYRRAGVAMFAGATAIRDLIERGRRTYHQRIVRGLRITNYDMPLAKAMDLLMQAGALAMDERDTLRECKAKTAAVQYFCLLSRYKYLYRCGLKDGATQELSKANWYRDRFLSLGGDDKLLKIVPDNAKAADYQRMGGNACIKKEAMSHER